MLPLALSSDSHVFEPPDGEERSGFMAASPDGSS